MREDDEKQRAALRGAVEDELERTRRTWIASGFAATDDPAAVGTLYRVPDALAAAHRVPLTAKLCILRREGDTVLYAPFSIDVRPEPGDVLIPPERSPYGVGGTGSLVIHLWARGRLPATALAKLSGGDRCPAIAELPIADLVYGVPSARQPLLRAWKSLAAAVARSSRP